MIFKFLRDSDAPRPLAGRLVGLAVGVMLLSLAFYIALEVVQALIPIVAPFVVLAGVYSLVFGRRRK